MIGERVSLYGFISKVSGGGIGLVYEVEDTNLGWHVALKFLVEERSALPREPAGLPCQIDSVNL